MKKFLIFIIIISAGFGVFYYQKTAPCRNPLTYDLGTFDNRFGISKDKFLTSIKDAEDIWEKDTGQNLFNYQSGGKLKINLIFDERQQTTIDAVGSKNNIAATQSEYDSALAEYKSMEASYKNNLDKYNAAVADFESQLNDYNARINQINQSGGATPQQYNAMEQERKNLETQRETLDSWRQDLNNQANQLNTLGDKVNSIAKELNIDVTVHNERFGTAREFDQGDYVNNNINIYEFDTISDLRLVLAHEFGHALGIDHVQNPKSIMYYLLQSQDLNNPALTQEDLAAFRARCSLRIPTLQQLFNY